MPERSALRADCTTLLGSGSRRRTHYASCARSVQTTAASQISGSAKARAGSRRRASAQPRSAGLVARARSALRRLTCRSCLNVASSATGPRDRASQGTLAQRGQAV